MLITRHLIPLFGKINPKNLFEHYLEQIQYAPGISLQGRHRGYHESGLVEESSEYAFQDVESTRRWVIPTGTSHKLPLE